MLYDDLKLGLAKHVSGEQRRRIDAVLRSSFDEVRDAVDWLRDSVGALEKEVNAVFFGDTSQENASTRSF